MLNIYVGKQVVKIDETNLLGMDINTLKSIPYDVAKKYAEYISALEVCIEDILDIPTDISDNASYTDALVKLETIIKEEEAMSTSNTKLNEVVNESEKEEVTMNGNNVTIETINEEEMGVMIENSAKEIINEEVKGFDKVKEAISNFKGAGKDTCKTIIHEAGVERERYIDEVDESFNTLKESFMSVVITIGNITGFSYLKKDIIAIIEAGTDGQSSGKSFFAMARKCEELINNEVKLVNEFGNEKDIKRVLTLKALTEDKRGKSIFEAFAALCVWLGKMISRKFASWGAKNQENKVFSVICNSIAKVANLVREGVKLVWKTAKFIVSYAVAGIIKLTDIVFRAIRSLYEKVKDLFVDKFFGDSDEYLDDFDDDFFTEAEDDEE